MTHFGSRVFEGLPCERFQFRCSKFINFSKFAKMAFPIKTFFDQMDFGESDAKALFECCIEAALEEAIDPAFLSPSEADEVTKGDSRLTGLLIEAGKRARPLIDSWAKSGVRAGLGGGEGAPGAVVEHVQRPPLSVLPPPGETGSPNA